MKSILILALGCCVLSGAAWGYGVDVKTALEHRHESRFVPINSMMFKMYQPDGGIRHFVRHYLDPTLLQGDDPWLGKLRPLDGIEGSPAGTMANVLTNPDFKGEKTEFCFLNGRLHFMSVGAEDYEFNPGDYAVPTNSIASLWPARRKLTDKEKDAASIWKDSGRFTVFTRNPNRSALILAELGMVALGVALFAGTWWWRILGFALGALSAVLVFLTQSRGGFLALVVGLCALLLVRLRRGVSRKAICATLALGALAAGTLFVVKGGERFTKGMVETKTDDSNRKRLVIWHEVPRMLAAAPLGWGLWQSGPAYNSWFERKENMHMVGDLFNDHLSRFVEGGFVLGGLYVFVWAFLLILAGRHAWRGGSPIPLAVWTTYFVACNFNSMNYWAPTFYVPAAVACFFLWDGRRRTRHDLRRSAVVTLAWSAVATTTVLLVAGGAAMAAPAQDIPLKASWLGRRVIAGHGIPQVWVVEDGFALDGNYYGFPGKEIRDFYQANPKAESLGLVSDVSDLPPKMRTLVLAGKAGEEYLRLDSDDRPKAELTVFLSPSLKYDKILRRDLGKTETHIVVGEFVARLEGGCEGAPDSVHVAPGAELYVPGWLESVIRNNVNE